MRLISIDRPCKSGRPSPDDNRWVGDEEVASEYARRVEVVGPAPISNPTGAFEQIFGTNQQVPHVGGSDKEAKVEADVSLTPAIAVTDCMSNGEGNLRLLT
jgi:hypothetical protein